MSDVWKANCEKAPIDTVRLLRELDGGIYLLAKQADRGGGVALSPASCRSLCAWLMDHGFGAEPEPMAAQAMRDNLDAASAAVADMGDRGREWHDDRVAALESLCDAQHTRVALLAERLGAMEKRHPQMERIVDNHDDRLEALERRFASMKDAISG